MSAIPGSLWFGFADRAQATPQAVALVDSNRLVSYRELADAAGTIAARLRASKVPPGSLVGLSVPRGLSAVAGLLGIWRHGCAYVPIDPSYPQARKDHLAADSRIGHVIVAGPSDDDPVVTATGGQARPVPQAAYVIYTSGSTGQPKGVVVRHAHVRALLDATGGLLPFTAADTGTAFHSYSFDFSVWEIMRPLVSGGTCVLTSVADTLDVAAFARLLARHAVTVVNLVPSVFGHLVQVLEEQPVELPALREIILGGEPVDLGVIRRWYGLGLAPAAQVSNMYGITETTVHVTLKRLSRLAAETDRGTGTPIGEPLPHLRAVLLDDERRPVPVGLPGEIYVSGASVSDGYLGRAELTAQRFVRLGPGDLDGIWYRSGDYAVAEAGGELRFLGRRDDQVQLHGYRVELGEIEAVLRRCGAAAGCAVVVADNWQGEPTLAACYVPAPSVDDAPARLRRVVRAELPAHMRPRRFAAFGSLPVTPEGKLDRRALAAEITRRDAELRPGPAW